MGYANYFWAIFEKQHSERERESYSAPSLKVTLLVVVEVLLATAEHVAHLGEELV